MLNKKQKIYADLDFGFNINPGTKDVSMSYDAQSVIRSIKNLLLTRPHERLFNPELSSHIDFLLFEPITNLTGNLIEEEVRRVISNWEPRATIASINVSAIPDQNGYNLSLFLYIGNQTQPTGLSLILKRSR